MEDQILGETGNWCAWQQAGFSAGTKGEAGGCFEGRAQFLLRQPRRRVDGRLSSRVVLTDV